MIRHQPDQAASRFDNSLRYRDETHPGQSEFTPAYVLGPVKAALGGEIELDPCTTGDNPTGALSTYYPPADGAERPWFSMSVFCNPPYGHTRRRWVARCIAHGIRYPTILLIPAHTETRIWQQAAESASGVCLIRGRVKTDHVRANNRLATWTHPSSLIFWNCPDADLLQSLGLVFWNRP